MAIITLSGRYLTLNPFQIHNLHQCLFTLTLNQTSQYVKNQLRQTVLLQDFPSEQSTFVENCHSTSIFIILYLKDHLTCDYQTYLFSLLQFISSRDLFSYMPEILFTKNLVNRNISSSLVLQKQNEPQYAGPEIKCD